MAWAFGLSYWFNQCFLWAKALLFWHSHVHLLKQTAKDNALIIFKARDILCRHIHVKERKSSVLFGL